jgi:hypothetical protein
VSVRPAWLPCTKVEDPASKVGVSYFDRLAVVDASGANVNRCGGEATHIGEQVVFGVMCEVVGLGDAEGRIGGDVDSCSKGVADPADAEFAESRRRGQAVRLPRMMLSKPLFPESMGATDEEAAPQHRSAHQTVRRGTGRAPRGRRRGRVPSPDATANVGRCRRRRPFRRRGSCGPRHPQTSMPANRTREPASLISGHAWIVRSTQTRPKS